MGNEPVEPKVVPVFPLPNVVLFPGMFLPLHIFEPRYRKMTADALAGERLIAMALLSPGWEQDYEGSPAIHPVIGVGKIIEDVKLEDGRYNLVLLGLSRVRVIEEIPRGPYRSARVEVLREREATGHDADRKRSTLRALYAEIVKGLSQGGLPSPPEDIPLGMLCDVVASLLSMSAATKQALLEELDVAARCDRLLRLLEGSHGPPLPPQRRWPKGPSLN
jgi:Lon protease-like protein